MYRPPFQAGGPQDQVLYNVQTSISGWRPSGSGVVHCTDLHFRAGGPEAPVWCRAQDETFEAPPPDDVGPEGVMGDIPAADVLREDELLPVPPEDPFEDIALQVGPWLSLIADHTRQWVIQVLAALESTSCMRRFQGCCRESGKVLKE